MSVLNKLVSYYPDKNSTEKGISVDLLSILQSEKHKETIIHLRQIDEMIQQKVKAGLPCYTVAGTFKRRCEEGLIEYSGLAAIDLDSAENYDCSQLTYELRKISCIAYVGLSCRGKRLFCIVPFLYPNKYKQQYERLIQSFSDMGLPMGDNCHKSISQPRFISWNNDETHFFNHNAEPYHLLPVERTYHYSSSNDLPKNSRLTPINRFEWCVEQINKTYSFQKGQRHNYLLHLVRYCNIKGLSEDDTFSGCCVFCNEDFPITEIKKIVCHIFQTHKDSHNKLPL
jgi:hypothetical protein